ENLKINGGDDIENDIPLKRRPVLMISKYTNDINDPLARSVEAVLGSFNRLLRCNQAQNMKETVLTNYF
ncbi:hypothetical protein EDB85DRAFT_1813998, partial [Lactarius pseudohatsudake]